MACIHYAARAGVSADVARGYPGRFTRAEVLPPLVFGGRAP
ncbi:MAG TPA: hypothetical protein VKV80_01640 [Streptosporangiaceae bacterium]|jgi:hypothetical protein|nr:hypothetical protein [Streptosporangiaceae bacterium]